MTQTQDLRDEGGTGDCFEAAIHYALDIPHAERENYRLVHGFPIGQGKIAGLKHAHAWIERIDPLPDDVPESFRGWDFTTCIDRSNGKDVEWPRGLYYGVGNIDPGECRYYEINEAISICAEWHHYGPWDDEHPAVSEDEYWAWAEAQEDDDAE